MCVYIYVHSYMGAKGVLVNGDWTADRVVQVTWKIEQ
jgi:hypothetical protein